MLGRLTGFWKNSFCIILYNRNMNEPSLTSWVNTLLDSDPIVRHRAFNHLLSLSDKALPSLLEVVRDPKSDVSLCSLVADILAQIPQSLAPLLELLADPDLSARSAATYALARMGEAAVPELIAALGSKDVNVRIHAAMALGRIGDDQAIAALITCFRDTHVEVQSTAAFSLGQIGPAILPQLEVATKDPDATVRRLAVLAIGKLGHYQALPILSYLLENELDSEVNRAVRRALEGIMLKPGTIDID